MVIAYAKTVRKAGLPFLTALVLPRFVHKYYHHNDGCGHKHNRNGNDYFCYQTSVVCGRGGSVVALVVGAALVARAAIVVGVALETVQALESQMLMRQYKGFLE